MASRASASQLSCCVFLVGSVTSINWRRINGGSSSISEMTMMTTSTNATIHQ